MDDRHRDTLLYLALMTMISCTHVPSVEIGHRSPTNFYLAKDNLTPEVNKAIVSLSSETVRCSGTIVSDEGHILTASHCLELCHHESNEDESICTTKVYGKEVRTKIVLRHACEGDITDTIAGATGDPKKSQCAHQSDVLLLKPFNSEQLEPYACLPISQRTIALGDRVFGIGFPTKSWRREGYNSDGESMYLSAGNVVEAPQCEKPNGQIVHFLDSYDNHWNAIQKSQVFIQTTVDNIDGNSGGPLLNGDGEVSAVSSFSLISLDFHNGTDPSGHERIGMQNAAEQCRGASFFAKLPRMEVQCRKRRLRLELPNADRIPSSRTDQRIDTSAHFLNVALDRDIQNTKLSPDFRKELEFAKSKCLQANSLMQTTLPVQPGKAKSFPLFFQFFQRGSDITIINLPGGPATELIKERQFFDKENAIYFDVRGSGCNYGLEQDFPPNTITTEQMADDFALVIDRLVQQGLVKKYILYGASAGSMLATVLATKLQDKYPNLQKGVVLEGIVGKPARSWLDFKTGLLAPANLFLTQHPDIQQAISENRIPFGVSQKYVLDRLMRISYNGEEDEQKLIQFFNHNSEAVNKEFVENDRLIQQHESYSYQGTDYLADSSQYVVRQILCREITKSFDSHGLQIKIVGGRLYFVHDPRSTDQCEHLRLDHPYDPAQYQIKSPIVYLEGSLDGATPMEGARYHFNTQRSAVNKIFVVSMGFGHSVGVENCYPDIWSELNSGRFDFSQVFNEQGHCRQ